MPGSEVDDQSRQSQWFDDSRPPVAVEGRENGFHWGQEITGGRSGRKCTLFTSWLDESVETLSVSIRPESAGQRLRWWPRSSSKAAELTNANPMPNTPRLRKGLL